MTTNRKIEHLMVCAAEDVESGKTGLEDVIAKSGIQSEIFNATRDGNVAKFLMSHQEVGTTISLGAK